MKDIIQSGKSFDGLLWEETWRIPNGDDSFVIPFQYFQALDEMDADTAEAFKSYCEQISSWHGNGKALDEQVENFQESYRG